MPGLKSNASSKKPSAPPSRRVPSPASKRTTSGTGWGAVVEKKVEAEQKKKAAEERKNQIWDFYLRDGESAIIQFINDEPVCMDGHNLKDQYNNFVFVPCQLDRQKHCLACRESAYLSWKAAFKVLDFREKNKKGDMVYSEKPTEKLFKVGQQLAQQIKSFVDKKGKELSEVVVEITRSGSGAKDTSYNLSIALDDDDAKIQPISWKEKFDSLEDIFSSPTDEEYMEQGYTVPADKDRK